MNKYESFLERTSIRLYKAIDGFYEVDQELEYAVKASLCADLVIFMIEALNKLNQQEITVETTDNLVDALGGVFPVTIFYTARDFAYSPEEAVALLANFYREGDDPDELVGTSFDFKTLMRGLYNFRVKEYFSEEREPIMVVSAVVPMMIRHVKVDDNDMELLQAIDKILVDCMGHIPNLVGSQSQAVSKKLQHSRKQSSSVHTPRDHTVICSGCSAKTRIKKDIGKYRCPKCSSLLVYVKDSLTAHYVGAEEITPGDKILTQKPKKLRKVNPLVKSSPSSHDTRTAAKVAHNTKPKNNAPQSDQLLTSNPPFTLSRYTRVALWVYFIEVSFFVIITILMSATAGRGISGVFFLVAALGGFGIFFERASGGNLYSGASIITSGDDSDGFISKIAEKAIIASFAISPLLGVYIATEILGF